MYEMKTSTHKLPVLLFTASKIGMYRLSISDDTITTTTKDGKG